MKRKNKCVFSKTLSLLLAATLVVCMLPGKLLNAKAASASFDVTTGNVSINASSYTAADMITITGITTTNTISVTGTGIVNIMLENVSIDVSSASKCAFSIASGATVNLTLNGTNILKSGSGCAGLQVPSSATLKINGTLSDSLTANGNNGGAGIGSGFEAGGSGIININGGIIHANGSSNGFGGAGIGGGYMCSGGTTTISGGTVTAIGGNASAGIGGGYLYAGGTTTISGGTVTAIGGGSLPAAGIGGGYNGSGGRTIISGGSVNANSISGKPTSDGSTYVYLTKVPLASGTPVNSLSVTKDSTPLSYGYNGMTADSSNELYLYFPAGSITASVNGSTTPYSYDIPKTSQTGFSLPSAAKTYGDAAFTVTATGGESTGAVSYSVTSGNDVVSVDSTTGSVTILKAGSAIITATKAADANYNAVTATTTLTVAAKQLSDSAITANAPAQTYTGGALIPAVTVKDGTSALTKDKDYKVYDETGMTKDPTFTAAGTYTLIIEGTGNYTDSTTVTFTVEVSSDATLSGLAVSSGTLSPAFASGTTSYTVSVPNSVSSVTVTPTVNDAGATVTVGGTAVISGSASGTVALTAGVPKEIDVVVKAQDGTTKTYTITVTRAAYIPPAPSPVTVTGVQNSDGSVTATIPLSDTNTSTVSSVTVNLGGNTVIMPALVLSSAIGGGSLLKLTQAAPDAALQGKINAAANSAGITPLLIINYNFMACDASGTATPVHNLSGNVTVTVALTETQIAAIASDPTKGKIYYYDDSTGKLSDMDAIFDLTNKTATFTTNHFSSYVLACSDAAIAGIGISYTSHIQDIGWEKAVTDGELSGTTGKSLRLEALKISLAGDVPTGASITYQAHVQKLGWQSAVSDGKSAGTTGKSLRVEAVKISLNGLEGYEVQYRAHVQGEGWLGWQATTNGTDISNAAIAGTTGQGRRLEAVEIRIVKVS